MRGFIAIALLVPATLFACINDRDTLAFEIRNVDALSRITNETDSRKRTAAVQELALRAIGGRFERFPNRYYQMRIDRLEKQKSLTAAEYDDLAVAYDRLGKVDQAIKILLASKSHRTSKDDEYRFHANYGTFLVHRWIVNGHTEADKKTLKQSIAEIEAALKINPNSHFGREKVQLALEKSWLAGSIPSTEQRILKGDAGVVGISGIIMMGLGYELVDAYLLMQTIWLQGQASQSNLHSFSMIRAKELQAQGKRGILQGVSAPTRYNDADVKEYERLRKDGEDVHQARLAYMKPRFDWGRHPDTHPDFWSEWKEPAVPVLNIVPDPVRASGPNYFWLWFVIPALPILAFAVARVRARKTLS